MLVGKSITSRKIAIDSAVNFFSKIHDHLRSNNCNLLRLKLDVLEYAEANNSAINDDELYPELQASFSKCVIKWFFTEQFTNEYIASEINTYESFVRVCAGLIKTRITYVDVNGKQTQIVKRDLAAIFKNAFIAAKMSRLEEPVKKYISTNFNVYRRDNVVFSNTFITITNFVKKYFDSTQMTSLREAYLTEMTANYRINSKDYLSTDYLDWIMRIYNIEERITSTAFGETFWNEHAINSLNDIVLSRDICRSILYDENTGMRAQIVSKRTNVIKFMYVTLTSVCMTGVVPPTNDPEIHEYFVKIFTDQLKADVSLELEKLLKTTDLNIKSKSEFVDGLIKTLRFYKNLVKDCFGSRSEFNNEIRREFENCSTFVSESPSFSVISIINTYVAEAMCNSELSVENIATEKVGELSDLYSVVREKDVFLSAYRAGLRNRIIHGTFLDNTYFAETKLFSEFLRIHGTMNDYLYRIKNLLVTYELQKTPECVMSRFKQYVHNIPDLPDYEVRLFDKADINVNPVTSMIACTQIKRLRSIFLEYYETLKSYKTCELDNTNSRVTLEIVFPKGTKFITMRVIESAVFTFLCDNPNSLISEIEIGTGLTASQVNMILKKLTQFLSHGDDRYRINSDYTSKMRKINIITLSAQSAPDNKIKEDKTIDIMRNMQLQSVIVRIMKSNRQALFNDILVAASKQLQKFYQLDHMRFKRNMAELISLDYIKRSDTTEGLFEYVA